MRLEYACIVLHGVGCTTWLALNGVTAEVAKLRGSGRDNTSRESEMLCYFKRPLPMRSNILSLPVVALYC